MAELLLREGNKVKFKVVVPAAQVSTAFDKITNALVRQVRIDGFRPGKAPKSVVEKRVGAEFLENEVAKQLIEDHYSSAVKELSLIVVDAKVEPGKIQKGDAFEFTVDAENYPEVVLPDWRAFSIEAKTPEVGEEDVQKALSELQQSRAKYEQVERAAEAEDLLNVEILAGEDEGKTLPVYLERAEIGVRNALLGQNVGAEVEVKVSGEAESEGEDAKETLLKVKILDIKQKIVPAVDEEFVKSFGLESVDTVEALMARLKSDLEAQALSSGKQAKRDEFVQKLGEGSQLEIPKIMIERRKAAMLQDLAEDLKKQSITLESYVEYLKSQGKFEEFDRDLDNGARLRVRNDLALEKLTEELGTTLEEEEFNTALRNYAVSLRSSVPNLLKALGDEGVQNFRVIATRDKALESALAQLGA
ncbi:MAG: trigger factor [Deinococcales bacterium]